MFFRKLNSEMASEENVDSWTNNFLLAGCALPKKEMKKTMNPNPPNHCDKERHRSRLRGKSSTEVSAEAPVVVNPDTDSKNPVRKLQFEIRMYGSAPNNVVVSHNKPVVNKMPRRNIGCLF